MTMPDRRGACEVLRCDQASIDRLLLGEISTGERRHHLKSWELQQQGAGHYLLAWRGEELAGRCTVFNESKYENVRSALGAFPEINALEARVQNMGIGTALLAGAERIARAGGHATLGIAVEETNAAALRLYERLGFRRWDQQTIVDHWDQLDDEGVLVHHHADEAVYLTRHLA